MEDYVMILSHAELADYVIARLNEFVKVDSNALAKLIEHRVFCNPQMAEHPEIQVQEVEVDDSAAPAYLVGFLGVLNGIVGTIEDPGGERAGWGFIAAKFELDGTLIGFVRTDRS